MRSFPINTKPAVAQESDGEIDLLRIFDTLRGGKWTIVTWMIVLFVLAGIYAFRMTTPVYTAAATVALQNRQQNIVDLATPLSALGGDYFTINTETETLASRILIGKLVDRLDLVADPVFNTELRPVDDSWSLAKGFGTLKSWIASAFRTGEPEVATTVPTAARVRETVIDTVLDSLAIANKDSSYVFYITVTTDDPVASARVANGLAATYVEDQIAMKYEATEQATLWLNGRVADLKLELEAAENAVRTYSTDSDLIAPETLAELNRQLKDRRDRVLDARTAAAAQAARVRAMEAADITGDPYEMAAAADDPTLGTLIERIDDPGVREAFDVRFHRMLERARFEARQANAKIDALENAVADLQKQVDRQSEELLKLEQLQREAAASRQIYEYFLGRLKEISVQQGIQRADSRILSEAVVPLVPSAPRKSLIMAVALFFGFLIGVAIVLLREMRQTSFRSSQELEMATGMTVIAQVPNAPTNNRRRVMRYLASKPSSAMAEAIRNLRTSVMLSNVDQPPQVIMVTSSLPGEGKTTQSLALAQSFASLGRNVLLIEGDIRRRTFQQYFRVRGEAGLIQAVLQDLPLEDVLHYSDELGVDVLVGEKSAINAADFFSSERMKVFFERLRAAYDIVIIDTPPVLLVPDARVIGQLADMTLYSVRWNRTTLTQVQEGLGALTSVDVKIAGLVLSQVDVRKAASYGGRYSEIYRAYGSKYYRN